MNTTLKERYIIDAEGNKIAIVLPIRQGRRYANEQYEQLLEDLHDLAIVAERRAETSVSLAQMKEWLKEDGAL